MQTTDHFPELLTEAEAARLLSISRDSFRRRVADGTLPPGVKLARLRRWRRDGLLAALDALEGGTP